MARNKSPQPRHSSQPQVQINRVQTTSFSGPLPPPDALEGYNRIVPDAAERIIAVFELEVKHRHDLEQQQIIIEGKDHSRAHFLMFLGQVMGFLLTLAFIGSGTFLIFHNKQVSGTIVSATAMVGIITAFLKKK